MDMCRIVSEHLLQVRITYIYLVCVHIQAVFLVRFSTVGGESGSPDEARDPRGFAMKCAIFYRQRWDIQL